MKLITFDQLRPEKGIAYSRDHLRRKVKAGEFPRPVPVSDSRIAWIEEEVDAWLKDKAAARASSELLPNGSAAAPAAADEGVGIPTPSQAAP